MFGSIYLSRERPGMPRLVSVVMSRMLLRELEARVSNNSITSKEYNLFEFLVISVLYDEARFVHFASPSNSLHVVSYTFHLIKLCILYFHSSFRE